MTKTDMIFDRLRAGWTDVPSLLEQTGCQARTLRAAISTTAKRLGIKIERRRENGVTSYRVAE